MLLRCFLDFSVGVGAFVIGLSQISSLFSLIKIRGQYSLLCKRMTNLESSLQLDRLLDDFTKICACSARRVKDYRISGIFRVGKIWRKYRLESVLNFH